MKNMILKLAVVLAVVIPATVWAAPQLQLNASDISAEISRCPTPVCGD